MPIITSKSQDKIDIRDFYLEAAQSSDFITQDIGKSMLNWIEKIDLELPDLKIHGLTSLYRLVLMPDENWTGEWSIIISSSSGIFYIEYLIPSTDAPWKNAYVIGETNDIDEAMEMVKIAIENSCAWR